MSLPHAHEGEGWLVDRHAPTPPHLQVPCIRGVRGPPVGLYHDDQAEAHGRPQGGRER